MPRLAPCQAPRASLGRPPGVWLPSAVSAAAPSPAAGILSKASCTSPGTSAESGELFQVSKETEWRGSEAVAWGVGIQGIQLVTTRLVEPRAGVSIGGQAAPFVIL